MSTETGERRKRKEPTEDKERKDLLSNVRGFAAGLKDWMFDLNLPDKEVISAFTKGLRARKRKP